MSNPAVELAAENGVDLVCELAAIATATDDSREFKAVEQRLIELLPIYRKRVNASNAIGDQDLLCALCDYSQPVVIEPALGVLPVAEQLQLLRAALEPDIADCCTEDDILAAINQPNGPLVAAGLCRIQTLGRNLRLSIDESLAFTSEQLRRERVEARLWHDRWPNSKPSAVPAPQFQAAA
jgi:hypothetical protein